MLFAHLFWGILIIQNLFWQIEILFLSRSRAKINQTISSLEAGKASCLEMFGRIGPCGELAMTASKLRWIGSAARNVPRAETGWRSLAADRSQTCNQVTNSTTNWCSHAKTRSIKGPPAFVTDNLFFPGSYWVRCVNFVFPWQVTRTHGQCVSK